MAIDYQALRNEIQNDPTAIGFAAMVTAGDTGAIADALNLSRVAINITRDVVPSYEVFDAIVPSEWAALSSQEKNRIQLILSMGQVLVKGTNTRQAFLDAFSAGTTTRTNLAALQTRKGSRLEQLFGAGSSISYQEVGRALGGA